MSLNIFLLKYLQKYWKIKDSLLKILAKISKNKGHLIFQTDHETKFWAKKTKLKKKKKNWKCYTPSHNTTVTASPYKQILCTKFTTIGKGYYNLCSLVVSDRLQQYILVNKVIRLWKYTETAKIYTKWNSNDLKRKTNFR